MLCFTVLCFASNSRKFSSNDSESTSIGAENRKICRLFFHTLTSHRYKNGSQKNQQGKYRLQSLPFLSIGPQIKLGQRERGECGDSKGSSELDFDIVNDQSHLCAEQTPGKGLKGLDHFWAELIGGELGRRLGSARPTEPSRGKRWFHGRDLYRLWVECVNNLLSSN